MNTSIPPWNEPKEIDVDINESGDPLKLMTSGSRIFCQPAYSAMGYTSASEEIWLRSGACHALKHVASTLPTGLTLVVWDGLRSLALQKEILDRYRQTHANKPSSYGSTQNLASQYVSPLPNSQQEFLSAPPPHLTGGAVDVTLGDCNGYPLDLGVGYDDFCEKAWLRHYESRLSQVDEEQRKLRRILYWAMVGAGFAPYEWEFWHFEFQTQRAAAFYDNPYALYGAAVQWESTGG